MNKDDNGVNYGAADAFMAIFGFRRMEKMDGKCNCSFSKTMTGDGCRYCQPQTYIDMLEMWRKEEREELEQQRDKLLDEMKYLIECGDALVKAEYSDPSWNMADDARELIAEIEAAK